MFWPIFFCAIWFSYVNEYMKDHWFSYIDDTFTLFDSENTATQFFHYLNNCHANIKFTIEFGDNSTNPFLDILNKRHSHTFSTSIYRKKTFIALNKMGLLHFEEIHSKTHLNSHFLLFPNLFLTLSFVLWETFCCEMDTLLVLSITTSMMFWAGSKTKLRIHLPQSPKKEITLVTPF